MLWLLCARECKTFLIPCPHAILSPHPLQVCLAGGNRLTSRHLQLRSASLQVLCPLAIAHPASFQPLRVFSEDLSAGDREANHRTAFGGHVSLIPRAHKYGGPRTLTLFNGLLPSQSPTGIRWGKERRERYPGRPVSLPLHILSAWH